MNHVKTERRAYDGDMAKVTVTLYIEEEDKNALQKLAEAEDRSLSQMAVLILKRTLKKAQDDGNIRPSRIQGRDDATVKQPSVADLPSQYRTNVLESKLNNSMRVTAAYLQSHELQALAAKIAELEKVAAGVELKFKVQIELGGDPQPSDAVVTRLNEILQEITENLKLE